MANEHRQRQVMPAPPTDRVKQRFTLPKELRPKPPLEHPVTDHALVRYFERVLGLDVEAIRLTILTPQQETLARSGVACRLELAPGITAVVHNGKVVTIK